MEDEEGAELEELQHPKLPSALWMNLDGDEAPIAIKILPNLLDENKVGTTTTALLLRKLFSPPSPASLLLHVGGDYRTAGGAFVCPIR